MDKSETFCPGNWVVCVQSDNREDIGQIVKVCPDGSRHVAPVDFYGKRLEHIQYANNMGLTLFFKYNFRAATPFEVKLAEEKVKMDCQNKGPFNPPTPQAQDVLDEARSIVTGARRQTHGEAERSFAKIARGWSEILGIEVAPFKVALCMDWLKTVRAVDGDSTQRDHFVDKCGYSALAAELALMVQEG